MNELHDLATKVGVIEHEINQVWNIVEKGLEKLNKKIDSLLEYRNESMRNRGVDAYKIKQLQSDVDNIKDDIRLFRDEINKLSNLQFKLLFSASAGGAIALALLKLIEYLVK